MSAVAAIAGFSPLLNDTGHAPRPADAGMAACRYWPCDLLAAFTLQMAARGCAVNMSMMLGSRDYAMDKLAQAAETGDDALAELSARMFRYFSDEPCRAATAQLDPVAAGAVDARHTAH